jgi:hypothetical protein
VLARSVCDLDKVLLGRHDDRVGRDLDKVLLGRHDDRVGREQVRIPQLLDVSCNKHERVLAKRLATG